MTKDIEYIVWGLTVDACSSVVTRIRRAMYLLQENNNNNKRTNQPKSNKNLPTKQTQPDLFNYFEGNNVFHFIFVFWQTLPENWDSPSWTQFSVPNTYTWGPIPYSLQREELCFCMMLWFICTDPVEGPPRYGPSLSLDMCTRNNAEGTLLGTILFKRSSGKLKLLVGEDWAFRVSPCCPLLCWHMNKYALWIRSSDYGPSFLLLLGSAGTYWYESDREFCVGHGHARFLAHRWWCGDETSLGKSYWVRTSGLVLSLRVYQSRYAMLVVVWRHSKSLKWK